MPDSSSAVSRSERWRQARRVLGVRLDTLGDVMMTGPALRAMKESAPGRHVTVLTSSSGAEAARLMPFVDDILVYEAPWMKSGSGQESAAADRSFIERLRAGHFDAAAIFTVYSQNPLPAALVCYLADIPLRLGHSRENPYRLLTDWVREPEPETCIRHEVRRQLDLVATVGAYTADERLSLTIPPEARERVNVLLEPFAEEPPDRWVVIHAGATAASRRYPPEHFAAVGRRLIDELGCRLFFTGTAAEEELVEFIRGAMRAPSHSLVGRLSLSELAALLERMALLISNNTGTVHVAAAAGTPLIDLYALTNPQHTPWHVPHRVLSHDVPCKFCYKSTCPEGHHDCLRLVLPDEVVRAAAELLAARLLPDSQTVKKGGTDLVHARS